MQATDFLAVLRLLSAHRAAFIVVGGVGAVLNGAPYNTFDLDIVHARDAANIERLLEALRELNAVYRIRPDLVPTAAHLASAGHQLLMTKHGPLDVLGAIGHGRAYEDLLPHTTELEIAEGLRVPVLNLEMLIVTKEEAGAEKDRLVLPLLRRTLEERGRYSSGRK
jgi:hypothetical protein